MAAAIAAAGAVAAAPAAQASYGFANADVVTQANSYAIGFHGGQCKVWAEDVVNAVLAAHGASGRVGGYGSPGGAYYGAYANAGGTLVSPGAAQPGDLVQIVRPSQASSDYPDGRLHTEIIVATTSTPGVFVMRASNWVAGSELVAQYQHDPVQWAREGGSAAYFWRFGSVSRPAQPDTPRVISTTGHGATVGWADVSNNEDSFTSQYRIGTGAWIAGPTVGANATSMTIGSLASGTRYTFQVGAHNGLGIRWSAYFYGSTVPLPAQPTSPHVTSTTTSSATVAWTDASNNEDQFTSQYRIGTGGWVAGPSVGPNTTSMTIGGLAAATTYTFQIGATNSVGTHWSSYLTGATPAPALPAQPTGPGVTSTSPSSAVVTWGDASNNEDSFTSQYRIGTGAWVAGPTVGANTTSMTIGGLAPATAYTFQVGAHNVVGTHWSSYFYGTTADQPPFHAGRQISIDSHASGGVSGHKGPGNSYATGPTRPANSPLWIVCYVNGQSISGPYNTTTIWDLSDDGYYYTDAWLYTGTNGPAVRPCGSRTVSIDRHATGGVSGHRGPANSYAAGPTRAVNSALTIVCYVNGESISGPYNTTTIWDLSDDGYYYTDAWLYTGTNGAAVPPC